MSSKKLYYILVGLVCLLTIGLVFGTYQANKLLTSRANTLTKLKATSLALEEQQQSIKDSKRDIAKYAELDKIAKSVVPEDKDQAQTVREIVKIADKYDIKLAAISFPASTLGTSKTGAPTTSTNTKAAALSQLVSVKNIPGVYQLQINVQSDSANPVSYSNFVNFLSALERNRRTAQVSSINLEPNALNRNLLAFTLTLNQYIKP